MLGTNPYGSTRNTQIIANRLQSETALEQESAQRIASQIEALRDLYGDSEDYWDAISGLNWDDLLSSTLANGQNLVDIISSGDVINSLRAIQGELEEELSDSNSYVTINEQYIHVERGSLSVKPKLNISQTDMYMDGEDGYSYTYMQWLNTTGIVVNMTCYSYVYEYFRETDNENTEGETKIPDEIVPGETMIHEALLWWARTFTTVDVYFGIELPNITDHSYKITDIEQTFESENVVKTELELTEYSQDEMEETYYRQYDISDLVTDDMSGDTSLAAQVDGISTGLSQDCNCTGSD